MNCRIKQLNISILQHRIVQATQKQQQRKIRDLQRLLIKSLSARIQTIFIASKIINEYSFPAFFSFFFEDFFLKDFFLQDEKTFLFFLYKKTKDLLHLKVQQTKFLESINSDFFKRFALTFFKKIFHFFIIINRIVKKLKEKKNFFYTKKNQKIFYDLKKMIEILKEKVSLKKKSYKLSKSFLNLVIRLKEEEKNIYSRSLFLLLWNSAFSPVIETLLKKKREKNFRKTSFKSKNFLEIKTKHVNKSEILSPWILKLEIQGFSEHLNNSWLFQNFPIESFILKKIVEQFKNNTLLKDLKKKKNFFDFLIKKKPFFTKTLFFNKSCVFSTRERLQEENTKFIVQEFLFHKDFLKISNSLSSKKTFFDLEKKNNFKTNSDNFFSFCLIGLESYLKDIFCILDEFYFSELIFPPLPSSIKSKDLIEEEEEKKRNLKKKSKESLYYLESKSTMQIFYYPRSIYFTGINRRQFKRINKLIDFFFKQRGLELDLKKTIHINLKKDFDLLGWTLKKTQKKDLMVQNLFYDLRSQKKEIKWLIKNSKHQSLHELVVKVNKKIKNDLIEYENQRLCKTSENVEKIYSELNFFINQIFWKWAKKRHNNRSNTWIFKKYWDLRFKRYSLKSHSLILYKSLKKRKRSLLMKFKKEEKNSVPYDKSFYKKKNQSTRRVFVLLYEKKHHPFSTKWRTIRKFSTFNKSKKDLYFLNFYSLDFQTQYSFFISLFFILLKNQ